MDLVGSPIVRCGWLVSSAPAGQRRDWWVLTAADSLSSFVSDSSSLNSPNLVLPLASITSVGSGTNTRSFQVNTSAQTYTFLAENDMGAESWRGAIEEARKLVCKRATVPQSETESTVLQVKHVLVELDLILQAMVGMLCGDDLLLERYGVQLTMPTHDRAQLLAQLGLDRKDEGSAACTRTAQVHSNATALLTQAEAEHRVVLLQDPNTLQSSTLAQIGENTKRLAALSVMLRALDQEQQNSFSAGGGYGGLRIDSSTIHNSENLHHEVVSLQNANRNLTTELSHLRRSTFDLQDQLQSSHTQLEQQGSESRQVELIQRENRQLKQQLEAAESSRTELQTAYNKLRDYTAELQQRCHKFESAFGILLEYMENEHTAVADLDLVLDSKLAQTIDNAVALQSWQQMMQFKLVPALKVMKHSSSTPRLDQASRSQQGLLGASQASILREQLAVSEQQILDRHVNEPDTINQHHVAALEARNRQLEQELSALELKTRQHDEGEQQLHITRLEAQRYNLETEIAVLEGRKGNLDSQKGNGSDGDGIHEELTKVHIQCKDQQLKIDELVQLVERFEQHHAATLAEYEREMAVGYALNQELGSKYTQLQSKAGDTMQKLKHLKVQLQEKEQHREEILRQAQTSFNELKEKYVALEQSHQERKNFLKTNEWNRSELTKLTERIRELEELQSDSVQDVS